jgi:DNA-binding PadR family transcriptional regulator
MAVSRNPEVTIEIVTSLYYGPQRASRLVKMVKESLDVSEPTVYSVLQDLVSRRIVEKDVRSRRNVAYVLTEKGRELIEREHFDAIGDILDLIKSAKRTSRNCPRDGRPRSARRCSGARWTRRSTCSRGGCSCSRRLRTRRAGESRC